ncbi:MAG: MacB family efflux pump subunit [Neisseriaceae bacterium]|nr:MacB family efflux pump subunit [Neisseriaceae bacterium]MBP6860927.1 MacB family efflux pump subunit [Neisseriaceae bacterium]
MNIIEIKGLNKYFGEGDNRVHILKDIDLSIQKGDFVAIIGQSGSGKSTLMNTLGCLDTPTSGSYKIDGQETLNRDANELAALRSKKFGFIFQRYNLLNSLTALDNVALPAVYSGAPLAERTERAKRLLTDLGLGDKLSNKPNELSGGQQQRVSIARALMNGGEVILADEPTGALDSHSGDMVLDILTDLHQQGHTIILVTHDPRIANYANRVIEIKDGVIIADERKKNEQYTNTKHSTVGTRNSLLFYKDQFVESFKMSIQAIVAHKLRSLLTMLGIIIGIASVVSVVALGRGSQEQIMQNINALGTNTINIYPGRGFGDRHSGRVKTLTVADSNILGQQSYLDSSTPTTSANGTVVYQNVSATAQLTGVGAQYFDVRGLQIERGRMLNADDMRQNASVVVIDAPTQEKLFPDGENPLGKVIIFDKKPLEVVGVAAKQDAFSGGSSNLSLLAPYSTVMNKITGQKNISGIIVKVNDKVSSQVAEKNLTQLLTVMHGGQEDFFTMNTDSIKQTIESTSQTMTLLISSIALISLVVGGIGVMNIMLVSVTERTKEIGVRMAIGARQYNILQQFLIEAILICLIGGAVGVMLSYAIAWSFNTFSTNFPMSFSGWSIVLALFCSTLIGVAFGFMPARNASKLNPIDALSRD